jgi:hypothetical protein
MMRKQTFCIGPTRAAKTEKNVLYRHDRPNELTKEGPLTVGNPDPALFVSDQQKIYFSSFFAFHFFRYIYIILQR